MSVLIRGMEMPKSCDECPLYTCMHNYDNCPLVHVPPHGDLIGQEWLVDIALHLMNTAKNDDIANGVKWLLQYIIESPTIIPAEEGETDGEG